MRILCSITVLCAAISLVLSNQAAERKALDDQEAVCRKELNIPDNAERGDANDCILQCVMEKIGVMDADNKLVPAKINFILDETEKTDAGKSIKEVSKDIAESCKSVTDPNKCNAAFVILDCLEDAAVNLGFDEDVFL